MIASLTVLIRTDKLAQTSCVATGVLETPPPSKPLRLSVFFNNFQKGYTVTKKTEDEQYTERQIKKYDITNAAIATLSSNYMKLKVKDVNDDHGHGIVREARIKVKALRCAVENTRKDLKKKSTKYNKDVDAEAKRITALIAPIENHLTTQEKIVTDEKERLEKEAQEAIEKKLNDRIAKVFQIGMRFYDDQYAYEPKMPDHGDEMLVLLPDTLETDTDRDFENTLESLKRYIDNDKDKAKAAEDAKEKEQAEKNEELKTLRKKIKAQGNTQKPDRGIKEAETPKSIPIDQVDPGVEMISTKKHSQFIFDRMVNVHGENEGSDYMIRFKQIIDQTPETQEQT